MLLLIHKLAILPTLVLHIRQTKFYVKVVTSPRKLTATTNPSTRYKSVFWLNNFGYKPRLKFSRFTTISAAHWRLNRVLRGVSRLLRSVDSTDFMIYSCDCNEKIICLRETERHK